MQTALRPLPEETGGAPRDGAPGRRGQTPKAHLRGAVHAAALVTVALASAVLGAIAALETAARVMPAPSMDRFEQVSTIVLDRRERLLRAYTASDGIWRLPVETQHVDARYLAMLMAFEDRRFRYHHGIDAIGVMRAGMQLLRNGRLVSGASTLTMQTARLLMGEHEKTLGGKLRQMVRARQLERRFSKDEILAIYLRLAPFGGNIEGTRAASLTYFGKEPRRLTLGEAALLVALPQSPNLRRPDRFNRAARRARDRVLMRAADAGVITRDEARRGRLEPVPSRRREFPMHAAHLADSEIARDTKRSIHRTTIDRDVQSQFETLAREHAEVQGAKLSSAILAVDHETGEIIAYVGSAGYLDSSRLGAIDMVQAIRSPGSTLKPLVYGLAFEAGLAHPETLIEDQPTRFGTYHPKNFDEDFRGTITVREALANSLNIPAVKVLAAVGPARMHGRLRRAGLTPALPTGSAPTLAIALGGMGLTLHDLTTLYAGFANGGRIVPLTHMPRSLAHRAPRAPRNRRVLSSVAAWYVTDILKDAPPPASARGGRIAYKTGTSYGFRDAWAVGYDGRHTIAVWIGRADGTATPGLAGRTAAGPILFDAFARLSDRLTPLARAPHGALRATSGSLPPPLRRFAHGQTTPAPQGPYLEPPVQIAFPPDRAELETDPGPLDPVVLKAQGGVLPLTWLADGKPIEAPIGRREVTWTPEGRGFVQISVIDAQGRTDRVDIRLK